MKLISGQFIEGNQVVKPEFGNIKQIKILKDLEKRYKKLISDGEEIELDDYDEDDKNAKKLNFICLCGKKHVDTIFYKYFTFLEIRCSCKRVYDVTKTNSRSHIDLLVVKLRT